MSEYQIYKQQVADACHTLLDRGYLKATEGNISTRIKDQKAFAITPSNYDYAGMQADDICILNYDASSIESGKKPSIESGFHASVYQNRPDANCIIHTHQPYVSALALINKPIPALFDEQVRFLGRSVDIIAYAPSGTSFLKNAVKSKIKNNNNAYIMKNHGALVLGGTMKQAIYNMSLLEKCALTYLLAILTEEKISRIPPPIREIVFAKLRADEKKFAKIEE